ncbi:MAG: gamma-glutamyltransferase [Candidatus Rokubacteria bacterium]|nr:gamma-glutamyltransferase [Candidatus Rokubacteria bacterium]
MSAYLAERTPTLAPHGLVASPHVLASEAGVAALRDGGSAVDAAIAANAVLAVAYPHMGGLGGDAFWLIYDARRREVRTLVAAGRAPSGATLQEFERRRLREIPPRSLLAVTVPGALDSWAEAHRAYGRLPWRSLFDAAIGYARDGVPVTAKLRGWIERTLPVLSAQPTSARVFLPGGAIPRAGDRLRQRDLARTIELVAEHGRDGFYAGPVARAIVAFSRAGGGLHSEADFAAQRSEWAEPLVGRYRGITIFQTPPPSQGFTTLLMLQMLEDDDIAALPYLGPDQLHLFVEAKKIAFADRDRYLADPAFAKVPVARLLSREYARERRQLIRPDRAWVWDQIPAGSLQGDTVYVAAVDAEGNAASLIQSLYMGFGSGIVAGETGVVLHNRGAYFSLDPAHPNRLEPGKRPLHTLMASLAFRDERLWLVFGCMGADGQPQIHLQVYSAMLDHGLDLAAAIEAPRWLAGRFAIGDPREFLNLDGRMPSDTARRLEARGHAVNVLAPWDELTGHAHGVMVLGNGVKAGFADPRSDGAAAGY